MLNIPQPFYMRNPDVVLREEDQDGALLFNPDTNRIRVVNPTGLFIWKLCDGKHAVDEIIQGIHEAFDGVPADEVTEQVNSFMDEMVSSGFIGTVEK